MDPLLDHLAQDADRARRMLSGVNDARSIRTLQDYADEADRRLQAARDRRLRGERIAPRD